VILSRVLQLIKNHRASSLPHCADSEIKAPGIIVACPPPAGKQGRGSRKMFPPPIIKNGL
ncbi:MAG: hypothetical protein K6E83_08360, partial [Clostridium sp.]|nr:hypothetical protein [Clostridium sp.]